MLNRLSLIYSQIITPCNIQSSIPKKKIKYKVKTDIVIQEMQLYTIKLNTLSANRNFIVFEILITPN